MTISGKSIGREEVRPEGVHVNGSGSTVALNSLSFCPLNVVSACHNSLLSARSHCGEGSPPWNGRTGDGWIEPAGGITGTAITPAREGEG